MLNVFKFYKIEKNNMKLTTYGLMVASASETKNRAVRSKV